MIKKYSNILFIAFAVLLLLQALSSCHKKKKTVYVAEELKEFFNYGIGSYWIFYDSVSNSEDSVYVGHNTSYITEGDYKYGEVITIRLADINIGKKTPTSTWEIWLSGTSSSMIITIGDTIIDNTTLTMGIPFIEQRRVYNDTNIYECSLYPVYVNVFGQNYTDVYKVYHGYEKHNTTIFINKLQGFIGILSKHSYWNKNMHLLRYHIEGS